MAQPWATIESERLEQLNLQIEQLTQNNSEWTEKVELLKTMPGIGQVITTSLVSDLPELGQLNAKKISRLVGVAPLNYDSGKHQGKRRIPGGRAAVRAVLYMGAVVAMRHNRENISFLRTSRREREVQKASSHRVRKI